MTDAERDFYHRKVEPALNTLVRLGKLPPKRQWNGCDEFDLERLRSASNSPSLALTYALIMGSIGRTPNAELFSGSGFFWPEALSLHTDAAEILADDLPAEVLEGSNVLLIHQGYLVFWCSGAENDPSVYGWPNMSHGKGPQLVAESIVEWLLSFSQIL